MSIVEKRTVRLLGNQIRYIDERVAGGGYASAIEVIRAGLRALHERDAAAMRGLHDGVTPVYDAMQADPGRVRPTD